MKKTIALYSTLVLLAFSFVSCLESDDDSYELYPYAALRSVTIGNINTKYNYTTSDGVDTSVVKVVAGAYYPFTVNQETYEAYNVDSLPLGTDVTRVATTVSCDGVAYIFVDSLNSFRMFSNGDSLDFVKPKRFLFTSTDGTYMREYEIRLNVHTVNPDELNWSRISNNPATANEAVRLFEKDGFLYLFGCDAENALTLSVASLSDASVWKTETVTAPFSSCNMNSLSLLNGVFYVVSDGGLYASVTGADWHEIPNAPVCQTLFAASDADNVIWAIANDSLAYSENLAEGFVMSEPLPSMFPSYDLSSVISTLRTNTGIRRCLLMGRTEPGVLSQPQVWGKLSTENLWSHYKPSSYNELLCPSLESMNVVSYDGKLYAIGGAGFAYGKKVEPLSAIYVSTDNGITWSVADDDGPSLPDGVSGNDSPFTIFVDSDNCIWLVICGDDGGIWRGRMNRFDL